jgi:hypothetical protein
MHANEGSGRFRRRARVTWAVVSYLAVQSLLLGVAALPAAAALELVRPWLPSASWGRFVALAIGLLPMYVVCAFTLAVATGLVIRMLGWRTRAGLDVPIAAYDWPLLDWARRAMCTHVVRLLVATPLRGTPLWTLFMRLNGAGMGRGVWINSVAVIDHELLRFGDGTVVGHDVHLSGHTIEDGRLKTGTVRVGRGVTIGVGAVVSVDVEIGDHCRVGALSFVPKHARLEAGATYAGIPVQRLRGT